jgi:hypothetical protein
MGKQPSNTVNEKEAFLSWKNTLGKVKSEWKRNRKLYADVKKHLD